MEEEYPFNCEKHDFHGNYECPMCPKKTLLNVSWNITLRDMERLRRENPEMFRVHELSLLPHDLFEERKEMRREAVLRICMKIKSDERLGALDRDLALWIAQFIYDNYY